MQLLEIFFLPAANEYSLIFSKSVPFVKISGSVKNYTLNDCWPCLNVSHVRMFVCKKVTKLECKLLVVMETHV